MCAAAYASTVILMDGSGGDENVRNAVEIATRAAERGAQERTLNVEIIQLSNLSDFYNGNNAWQTILRARNIVVVGSYDTQSQPSTHMKKLFAQTNIPFHQDVRVAFLSVISPPCCACGCNEAEKFGARMWSSRNGLRWISQIHFSLSNYIADLEGWKALAHGVGQTMTN